MRRDDRSFRSRAGRGAVFVASFMLVPAVGAAVAGAASEQFDAASLVSLVLVGGGVMGLLVSVSRAAAFVDCSMEQVTVGLSPVWRTRLAPADIADVDLVQINAYEEYRGWGIKGSARGARGRLYSVGGSASVKLTTVDGRVFVVSFVKAGVAAEAAEALKNVVPDAQ